MSQKPLKLKAISTQHGVFQKVVDISSEHYTQCKGNNIPVAQPNKVRKVHKVHMHPLSGKYVNFS